MNNYNEIKDMKEINEFITKVFNYFNGKVNRFQLARLTINWCEMQISCNGAITTNPNQVIVYPRVLKRFSNSNDQFIFNIILVVIHELYHVDQNTIFDRMSDPNYLKMIEDTVEVQSMSYMYNHINEISKEFGLNLHLISNNVTEYLNYYSDGYLYTRKKYIDHLFSMIADMIGYCELLNIKDRLLQYYNDPKSVIGITINGKSILIKYGDALTDINVLNDFMYNTFYKGNCHNNINFQFEFENNELHMNLTCNTYNCVIK